MQSFCLVVVKIRELYDINSTFPLSSFWNDTERIANENDFTIYLKDGFYVIGNVTITSLVLHVLI